MPLVSLVISFTQMVPDRYAEPVFTALLTLTPQMFKLFMDSIFWAFKHTMRDIADIGLSRTFNIF